MHNTVRVSFAILTGLMLAACGVEGPPGQQGPKGDPGTLLLSLTICRSQRTAYVFSVERWDYTDGSVFVHCQIQDASTAYDTVAIYKASMPGAPAGACVLPYDLDTPNGGFWQFLVAKGGVNGASAQYTDASSPSNGYVIQMSCDNR